MRKGFIQILLTCLILSLNITTINQAYATHMVGGEVSYRCIGVNQFELKITLYQSCLDGTQQARDADFPIQYTVYENRAIPLYVTHGAISFLNSEVKHLPHGFTNECISNIPNVCLQRSVGTTILTLPPSEYGYTIVYQRCCRNADILNLVSSGNIGVTYSATIPPFESGECPNNSPEFVNMPPQIICGNFPFSYSYAATDMDGDSLVYKLCETYLGASMENPIPSELDITPPPFFSAPYSAGYSATNPINGFPPVNLDPATGMMTVTPTSTGRFQVKVCIEEYRNGQLINVHSRDLQYQITNCEKLVYADMPAKTPDPKVYDARCDGYTVKFENSSVGGITYNWDFGDGSPESTEFEPTHTYADTGTYEVKLVINRGTTCSDSITKYVKIYPYFTGDFSTDGSYCPGTPVAFMDSLSATYGTEFKVSWDFGDGTTAEGHNPVHTFDTGGTYWVTMYAESELGCILEVSKEIMIYDFTPSAGNDTMVVLGYDFNLQAKGGDHYSWHPTDYLSDPFIANPKVTFPDTGSYTFTVDISRGEACKATDTVNVIVVAKPLILLPNAFSPNGDGLNDVFKPVIVGYPFAEYMRIYNRWGDLVYSDYRWDLEWDGTYNGKPADAGVYIFEFSAKNIHGESEYVKGDVTLIR